MLARRGETATVLLFVARETDRNQIYVLVPLWIGIVPAVCELWVLAELIAVMHKIVRADLSALPAIKTFRLLFPDPLRKLPPLLVTVKLLGASGSYKFSYLVCSVHNLCKYKRPLHYTTTFCISIQGSISCHLPRVSSGVWLEQTHGLTPLACIQEGVAPLYQFLLIFVGSRKKLYSLTSGAQHRICTGRGFSNRHT